MNLSAERAGDLSNFQGLAHLVSTLPFA